MAKPDDKGAAAVRSIMAGASLRDMATILGVPRNKLRRRLQMVFTGIMDPSVKKKNKGKKKH